MVKKFGFKSITRVLYATCLLLPMFAVFGRLIYTQSNPNAKDSYFGQTINNSIKHNEYKNLEEYYSIRIGDFGTDYTEPIIFSVSNVKIVGNCNQTILDNVDYINEIYFYRPNNQLVCKCSYSNGVNGTFWYYNAPSNLDTIFSFYLITKPNNLEFENYVWYYTYNNYSYLDNAFEYSLYTFTDDNNLGGVDFFGWFTNLFLNQSNTHNALYLNFVNWYLNYSLLVSSGYLLFLVLIWFINYVRRIMDKSMNYEGGGF